jgi:hypothetical protein
MIDMAKRIEKTEKKADYFRINMTLPSSLDAYLDQVGSYARATGGFKLPKTAIIRSLIRFMQKAGVDCAGLKTEEEVEKKLLELIKK